MNSDEIKRMMIETLVASGFVAPVDAAALQTKIVDLASLDIDSLTVIELCMKLEDSLGFPVEPTDILHHPTLDAISTDLAGRPAKP